MPAGRGSGDAERGEILRRLDELGDDPAAAACRKAVCRTIAQALADTGRLFWVTGLIVGPDRASGTSPFGFGDDQAVGVATVAQIGGELAVGAVQLLMDGNLYAGSALIRQLVEVEYLAFAFAEEHKVAADWLRADRKVRHEFWQPKHLRERAGGRFLRSDYGHHCDIGGHPTIDGMSLLPDHKRPSSAWLWADLAGHLQGIWKHLAVCAERVIGGPIPEGWKAREVKPAIDAWLAADGLYAALQDLGEVLHGTPG